MKSGRAVVAIAAVCLCLGLAAERHRRDRPTHPLGSERIVGAAETAALFEGRRMQLATVDPAALCIIPGIGPKLAARIIDARDRGLIQQPSDVSSIRGLGEKRAARLLRYVDVAPGS